MKFLRKKNVLFESYKHILPKKKVANPASFSWKWSDEPTPLGANSNAFCAGNGNDDIYINVSSMSTINVGRVWSKNMLKSDVHRRSQDTPPDTLHWNM